MTRRPGVVQVSRLKLLSNIICTDPVGTAAISFTFTTLFVAGDKPGEFFPFDAAVSASLEASLPRKTTVTWLSRGWQYTLDWSTMEQASFVPSLSHLSLSLSPLLPPSLRTLTHVHVHARPPHRAHTSCRSTGRTAPDVACNASWQDRSRTATRSSLQRRLVLRMEH